jgi:hypothetical protein
MAQSDIGNFELLHRKLDADPIPCIGKSCCNYILENIVGVIP